MKKLVLFIVLISLCQGAFLLAQTSQMYEESEYYYFNFTVEKVYVHRLGFVVTYRGISNYIRRTFIPHEWFRDPDGKGEIIYLGSGKEWPSMTVYYRSGEFSHVRLRVRHNKLHETWGVVPSNTNIDEYFRDLEEVRLEF